MPVGRPMPPLTLSEDDVRELENIASSRSMPRAPPSARKVDASPSRLFQPPGGLMNLIYECLQRGRQG
jgi:hypothetical protein